MNHYLKLSPLAMGLALGIIWSLSFLSFCMLYTYTGYYGLGVIEALSGLYIGFEITSYVGILIGVAWAFLDAFLGGLILAFLYNLFVR